MLSNDLAQPHKRPNRNRIMQLNARIAIPYKLMNFYVTNCAAVMYAPASNKKSRCIKKLLIERCNLKACCDMSSCLCWIFFFFFLE